MSEVLGIIIIFFAIRRSKGRKQIKEAEKLEKEVNGLAKQAQKDEQALGGVDEEFDQPESEAKN